MPPSTPPAVTAASIVPASGGTPSYLTFSTDTPPIVTPVGRFTLVVVATTTDGAEPAQAALNTTLDRITPAPEPPASTSDTVGPAWLAPDGTIGVVLNPPAGHSIVSVRISVTDPRGRAQSDPTEVLP